MGRTYAGAFFFSRIWDKNGYAGSANFLATMFWLFSYTEFEMECSFAAHTASMFPYAFYMLFYNEFLISQPLIPDMFSLFDVCKCEGFDPLSIRPWMS